MTLSRNTWFGLGGGLILVGAYLFFQGGVGMNTPEPEVATTTTATATTSVPAAEKPKGTAVISQSGLKVNFVGDTFVIGEGIPTITFTVPKDSDGKVLVLTLVPSGTTVGRSGVLLATEINPTDTTYAISGLHFSTLTDTSKGTTFAVTPGTYVIEAVLWDWSPLGLNNTYTNLSGNNGLGTRSAPFTLTKK